MIIGLLRQAADNSRTEPAGGTDKQLGEVGRCTRLEEADRHMLVPELGSILPGVAEQSIQPGLNTYRLLVVLESRCKTFLIELAELN
jgi:hypothetical protein